MKKINIAELIKDCPQGMELDCTMYNKVSLLSVSDSEDTIFPIKVIREDGNAVVLTKYGQYTDANFAKCVIFPKGKNTWEGFVPPCKFKDGDVISDSLGTCIFKREGNIKGTVDFYCGVVLTDCFRVKDSKSNPDGHYGNIVDYRFATEEERQKLFKAIKDNGYEWNAETKTLEELVKPIFKRGDIVRGKDRRNEHFHILSVDEDSYMINIKGLCIKFKDQNSFELVSDKFDINTLKPFESRVLVRDREGDSWLPATFGCKFKNSEYPFFTMEGGNYKQCIPYDKNKELNGTSDNCDEYYKTW